MRIAQLIIEKICHPILLKVDTLEKTERSCKGFGSNGLGKNMAKILISLSLSLSLSFSWSRTVVYLYIRAIACQIEYNLLYSSGWQWLLSRVIKVMLFNCQGYMATLVESYQSY